MNWTKRVGKWLVFGGAFSALAAGGSGCLTRPVGGYPPTTKVNFQSTVSQQQVDKVDLLFLIDNSASMGDKQVILADAVPNLVDGLLKPKCVDPKGTPLPSGELADPLAPKDANGVHYGCPKGSDPEFKPVSDMHIGIISSSLGGMGGDVCPDSDRFNDKAHLLNINKQTGMPVAAANPGNFLAWFPKVAENDDATRHPAPKTPTGDIASLTAAFKDLVVGTDQTGCGLEAQLESIYRFLIQPDPWVKVVVDKNNQADLGADNVVDVALLQQRADFLREQSLVAVIALTDEEDSSADPLSVGGQGWAFMARNFPGSAVFRNGSQKDGTTAPRATSACTAQGKGPGHEDCTSCGFQNLCNPADAACQRIKNDPNCAALGSPPASGQPKAGYAGYYGPTDDNLNVRFHRMKERFGIDPQYPLERYVDGFTKFKVPDRKAEHPTKVGAGGRREISAYQRTGKCTNPLFARSLPRKAGDEVCNLPRSTRSPDTIFFAVVGGVPNSLLHFTPGDAEKSRITSSDYQKILGRDPNHYDYTGIDPHMIQSVAPRGGITAKPSAARGDNGNDPLHGREWDTSKDDLQYACTFNLPQTRKCTADDASCDCANENKNPPLCGQALGDQVKAKAYPTIREFSVVRALGDQGIIASLCPIQLDDPTKDTYGYKPAVAAIIDRLKNALTTQCLPEPLTPDATTGEVPCRVLALLGQQTDTCEKFQLQAPPKEIVDVYRAQLKAESGDVTIPGATDLSTFPICDIPQDPVKAGGTCKDNGAVRWCYVVNQGDQTPAGRCPQALIFSVGAGQLQGAQFSLQCINQFGAGQAAGDQGTAKP